MAVSKPTGTKKPELCRICKERPVPASALRRHHHECNWCANHRCRNKRTSDRKYRSTPEYREYHRYYMLSWRRQRRIRENRI